MKELNEIELIEINAGSQASYEAGFMVGTAMRRALVIVSLLALL